MDDSPLLFDLIRTRQGDTEKTVERYLRGRSDVLHEAGVAKASHLYQLRHQNVPATPLGETVLCGVHVIDDPSLSLPFPEIPSLDLIGSATYISMARCGTRLEPTASGPPTTMIVLTHPTDLGYDESFNTWYSDEHMPDVALTPGFRAATRYRPVTQPGGTPLGYLCIYEVDVPFTASIDANLDRWQSHTEVPDRVPMPKTLAGDPVLSLDLWGYFSRLA
jgi:hypothetical protein